MDVNCLECVRELSPGSACGGFPVFTAPRLCLIDETSVIGADANPRRPAASAVRFDADNICRLRLSRRNLDVDAAGAPCRRAAAAGLRHATVASRAA